MLLILSKRLVSILSALALFSQIWLLSGVQIEYLPPYLPDLSPIEEAFFKIKSFICRHQSYYHRGEHGDGFMFDMLEVMDIITPEDAEGYYFHVGYF